MSDELVTIDIDLPEDVILKLSLIAHERDMKLNDLIVEILIEAVARSEKQIEELRKEYNRNVEY